MIINETASWQQVSQSNQKEGKKRVFLMGNLRTRSGGDMKSATCVCVRSSSWPLPAWIQFLPSGVIISSAHFPHSSCSHPSTNCSALHACTSQPMQMLDAQLFFYFIYKRYLSGFLQDNIIPTQLLFIYLKYIHLNQE